MFVVWMVLSHVASGLEVDVLTYEDYIRAKHLSSAYHVSGFSLFYMKYLI